MQGMADLTRLPTRTMLNASPQADVVCPKMAAHVTDL
jgi:hypothetical protein